MVKDTRAPASIGDIRALNQPHPLAVKTGDGGVPTALKLRGRWVTVESIVDRWRIDDEWWREQPISRMYYECAVDQGLRVTVFKDSVSDKWSLQRA